MISRPNVYSRGIILGSIPSPPQERPFAVRGLQRDRRRGNPISLPIDRCQGVRRSSQLTTACSHRFFLAWTTCLTLARQPLVVELSTGLPSSKRPMSPSLNNSTRVSRMEPRHANLSSSTVVPHTVPILPRNWKLSTIKKSGVLVRLFH